MEVSALESHAAGRKHTNLVEKKKSIKTYFSGQHSLSHQKQSKVPGRKLKKQLV